MKIAQMASCALVVAALPPQTTWSAELSQQPLAGGAHFSKELLNTLFGHPVNERDNVRQRIKKAITTGTSKTIGEVTVELIPDAARGRMDIRLRGTVNINDAVATQGCFRVCSRSATCVDVRKPVIFDRDGLHVEAALARCKTNIRICDVWAKPRILKGYIARRSHRALQETECIVSQRARQRFEDRLDERIGSAIEELDSQFRQQLQFDAGGFGLLPPEVSFASTDDHLQLWIDSVSNHKFSPPPQSGYLDSTLDIHVVLHEQVFETFGGYRYAGRRIDDQQVLDGVEALRGSAPASLQLQPRRPGWSMKMADTQPLSVRLADGAIHTLIQLAEFQSGREVLDGPIEVEVTVRPEITAEGLRLIRTMGPKVRVGETGEPAPTGTAGQLTELLRQKFEGIFPPTFDLNRRSDPEDDTLQKLSGLALTRMNIVDGWFELGFQFPTKITPGCSSGRRHDFR